MLNHFLWIFLSKILLFCFCFFNFFPVNINSALFGPIQKKKGKNFFTFIHIYIYIYIYIYMYVCVCVCVCMICKQIVSREHHF